MNPTGATGRPHVFEETVTSNAMLSIAAVSLITLTFALLNSDH